LGYELKNTSAFDTLAVSISKSSEKEFKAILEAEGINIRYTEDLVCISLDETTELDDVAQLVRLFGKAVGKETSFTEKTSQMWDLEFNRDTAYLEHPVFNTYHTEHEMLRYLKTLENKDLSLAHSMIALGSCTMKLNATSEMIPVTWESFGNIHPFAPKHQLKGYTQMLHELERDLSEITGFHRVSLQPNAGAQGEYTGLMTIRHYFMDTNQAHRDIVIIPESAHGTNPASAVMAGMKVIVVKCHPNGYIDLNDLRAKAEANKDNLAAVMVTYPSTTGVYEETIKEITSIIHQFGGQVYMDGANMNAQVGYTNPANIGADVCHLNLHKTFAIPHGGGGPGVGPICVAPQLVPFLPTNPIIPTGGEKAITAISAAPWGSALACLISYGYIAMLGAQGVTDATRVAILNANYIKERLDGHYKTLYKGEMGRAAHEMIIDCRDFKENGIEVVDVAKRLMDYGFHAPTVSFPVAGTMMIEPTESENIVELDRFCDAMIAIRKEVAFAVKDEPNNVLKNAPHTMAMITADEWDFPYSRQIAAFPLEFVYDNKFWPTVRRVDEAFGDRNLICSCNPIEDYMEV